MQTAIQKSQANYQAVQAQVLGATEEFRSNSRFFVQPGSNNNWSIIGADDNRLYGQRKRYFDAVTYAESLERAIDAKSVPALTVRQVGERATRWGSLLSLLVIIAAAVTSA
ncbi:hypothetical protein KW869_09900 [Pseudomonas urmiensis]|uniref:Uncharacterized protein n=1 Tax=Pseudomonas urmiensis TaxID=2745493 RepID=A0ABW8NV34_9PSED